MKKIDTVLSSFGTTIFEAMSGLAREHNAVNLGQGFPDEDGPEVLKQVAIKAILERPNQYPPMYGVPELRQAVADHNKTSYGLDVDWQTEVLVTSGATEALAACFLSMVAPGDEVVLIEPMYDCYLPMILRAGGVPVRLALDAPNWALSKEKLEAAFSDKTKLILLNSPHNPTGKVFTIDELNLIAEILIKYGAYAVCDEVYEHIIFDGAKHTPLMTLPKMRDRCVRIGSAGKSFSMTGWKVGYLTAPPELFNAIAKAHQFLAFTTPPMLQYAVAEGLRDGEEYFSKLSSSLQEKRDYLKKGLEQIGFDVLATQGTYFLTADIRSMGYEGSDEDYCREMTIDCGVTAVPNSAFYAQSPHNEGGQKAPDNYVRFCFCKKESVLKEALDRLAAYYKR